MAVDMTPPPVIEFAEKSGYTNGVDYVGEWKNYNVYIPNYPQSSQNTFWGLPQYILFKNNDIRWANDNEQEELMDLN